MVGRLSMELIARPVKCTVRKIKVPWEYNYLPLGKLHTVDPPIPPNQ